jgi:hypothetical protein
MSRSTNAAFSALRDLDPVAPTPGVVPWRTSAEASVEMQIARILASPDGHLPADHTRGVRRWTDLPPRSRYGTLGLVASASLAVIATLVWVSPSAGAPLHNADRALGQVGVPAAAPALGHPGADPQRLSSRGTAVVPR